MLTGEDVSETSKDLGLLSSIESIEESVGSLHQSLLYEPELGPISPSELAIHLIQCFVVTGSLRAIPRMHSCRCSGQFLQWETHQHSTEGIVHRKARLGSSRLE